MMLMTPHVLMTLAFNFFETNRSAVSCLFTASQVMKTLVIIVILLFGGVSFACAQTKKDSSKLKADIEAIRQGKEVKTDGRKSVVKVENNLPVTVDTAALKPGLPIPTPARPNNPNPYNPRPDITNPTAPATVPADPTAPPGVPKGPGNVPGRKTE
jgi:hypothetical protein